MQINLNKHTAVSRPKNSPKTIETNCGTKQLKQYIDDLKKCEFLITIINGEIDWSASRLPKNIALKSLHDLKKERIITGLNKSIHKKLFGSLSFKKENKGFFLHSSKGGSKEIIRVCVINSDLKKSPTIEPVNNVYFVSKRSELNIVEEFWSSGDGGDQTSRWLIEDGGRVTKYTIGTGGLTNPGIKRINTELVIQRRNSTSSFYSFYCPSPTTASDGSVKNRFHIQLLEEGGVCELQSISLLSNEIVVNNDILMEHYGVNCKSAQVFKGIYAGSSSGIFDSCVLVKKGAQETNSLQRNQNLLLSETASINSNPKLEIFADNVECAHGSTTGEIDKGALFYLNSRGIGRTRAINLLLSGFISSVLESIPHEKIKTEITNNLSILDSDYEFN